MVAPSGRCAGRCAIGRPDGGGAGQEVLVARVARSGGPGETLPGFGAARLEQARQLRRRTDPGRSCALCAIGAANRAHAQALFTREARWPTRRADAIDQHSTMAPATSMPVACCSPSHPGMPFTSSTNTRRPATAAGRRRRSRRRPRPPRASPAPAHSAGSVDGARRAATRDVGAPLAVGRLPLDRAEDAPADDEDADVAALVIDGSLHVEHRPRSARGVRTTRNATSGSLDAHQPVSHRAEDRLDDDAHRPSPASTRRDRLHRIAPFAHHRLRRRQPGLAQQRGRVELVDAPLDGARRVHRPATPRASSQCSASTR